MDLGNLQVTTNDEIDAELLRLLANRQALYDVSSELIMLDYRPEFAKLHRRGSRALGHELKVPPCSTRWGTCSCTSTWRGRRASSTQSTRVAGKVSHVASCWTSSWQAN